MGIQDQRQLALQCPLGEDVLLLRNIVGTEQLGRCFRYELTLYSLDFDIEAEQLLGRAATVHMQFDKQQPRFLNGIATEFAPVGYRGRYAEYRMVLRPWLWLLSRNSNCRIYQRQNARDIIMDILSKRGCPAVEDKLMYALPQREYCVQYRESDLNFIQRLMEDEGRYFYFRHEADKHVLVLADSQSAHEPVSGIETLHYQRIPKGESVETDPTIVKWTSRKRLQAGKVALNDYDFEKPRANITTQSVDPRDHPHADAEVYDYPGGYHEVAVGEDRARVQLQAILSEYETVRAETDAAALFTGALFTLDGHPRAAENRQYLVKSRTFHADSGDFESGGAHTPGFNGTIHALDSRTPFRPANATRHPSIGGPQTATVVGPKTSEIATDHYGRVKVRFHWDREKNDDSQASCWIRVAQGWAGSGWGAQFIPRIGQEVVVEFLEGAPDRPIITGCVYNKLNTLPYELPAHRTQSGIKTRSTQGGGPNTYNELRFEDKQGSEQLVLRAQRDLSVTALHDVRTSVGNHEEHLVDGSRVLTIGKDESHQVEQSLKLTVGQAYEVLSKHTISQTAEDELKLKVGEAEVVLNKLGITLKFGTDASIKLSLDGITLDGAPLVKING